MFWARKLIKLAPCKEMPVIPVNKVVDKTK
jgi:hypothetical protein